MSISGLSDRTLADVATFRTQLEDRGVPASFLVAPRVKGGYRLDRDATTVDWLVEQRIDGDAIVLHGFAMLWLNGAIDTDADPVATAQRVARMLFSK